MQLRMVLSNTTSKLSELPFLKSPFPLPLTSPSPSSTLTLLFFSSSPSPSKSPLFPTLTTSSSLPTTHHTTHSYPKPHSPKPNSSSSPSPSPWLTKWAPPNPSTESPNPKHTTTLPQPQFDDLFDPLDQTHHFQNNKGPNAIQRIALRLRNLGLGSDDENDDKFPVNGDGRLGNFLQREWVRPDAMLSGEGKDHKMVLPWEKEEDEEEGEEEEEEEGEKGVRKKRVKALSLAEQMLEEEELKRLRRVGMKLREKVNVPQAGLTRAVLEKIRDQWKKSEVVRLKFHEVLARDMKTAHHIIESRTKGLVIWRAGSVMWVYCGKNYDGSTVTPGRELNEREGDSLFVPDVSAGSLLRREDSNASSSLEKSEPVVRNQEQPENMTEEEAEFNRLLDGLGPRFVEWWGTGILPVDADLLPPTVPGYKPPLRLLPIGMHPRLTDPELTNLRKLSKSLPCHFALGRNRNLQGLACAILKLWEKSLVAKIAVKRGLVNTNNELMAAELKKLTGGTLLIRNKYYIVIYRGKDFVPTSVAAVIAERQELTKQVQDAEEKVRCRAVGATPSGKDEATAQAGSLAEFYEAQANWGRDISTEEREKMIEESAKAKNARLVKKIERKLALAQVKRLRAEKLLAKIEASLVPAGPDYDRETITDEERVMFRRLGLIMKPYLPLSTRGVFAGVIENMHLHWKHRELVKLLTKQKTLAFVEDTARLLEYESGGILVSIDRAPKGFVLIYYRGKNYRRPITIRPRNLLTKAKALKRSIAMQRHEALSQHITELGKKIEEMKKELGLSQDLEPEDRWSAEDHNQIKHTSEFTQSEDDGCDGDHNDGGFDDEEDSDWDDEDSEFSNFENDGYLVKAG